MIRQEIARLTNIQDTVRKYTAMKGQLQCACPFHNGPEPTLIWNSKHGTYHCKVCQTTGDIIDYVMKMEGWDYTTTFRKLAGRLKYLERGTVYVLALADGCYYIGYTLGLVNRMNLHFSGKGAYWTKLHPPIKIVKTFDRVKASLEDKITEQYFARYGRDKVRGGKYVGADFSR